MSLDLKLKEVGFTPNEVKIYLHILEKGTATPPKLSRAFSMPRSNIHYVLKNLVEKDVLRRQMKGKRFVYVPNDPTVTLQLAERKRKAMEELVPDLQALFKKNTNKPVIKFYEGIGEIANIFEDILVMKEKKLIAFASIKKLFSLMPKEFPDRIQKTIKQKEIFFQEILTPDSKDDAEKAKQNMFPYHEYKVLPEKNSDFPTDILVWDDSIALITLSEPVFGVVLVSKPLADTYRINFEIMWKSLNNTAERASN